ncbi:DUF2059 domain-containing protein [Glaciecola sp. 33A]|uniref:DUF2059 domain-containing protein n=1 Tax=Glaciecola sp. 33A TaxID=2057807 RepID=UPI000C339BC5|nr:DUF2059 domain-containing protein [Glaciecola sp. 33A]PKI01888.1 hypothetical protein CXF81_09300 [Glaciecola sp. 33A]
MMKKILVALALVFAFTVSAQNNKEADNLDELFELMDMDSMVETMYDQMQSIYNEVEKDVDISPEELAINQKYREQMTNIMKKEMSWQAMKVDLKQIYLQNFTESEIADMLIFYKSPTGQSVLRTMPVVMQESMKLGQAMAQKALPKIQALTERKLQERQELRDNSNSSESIYINYSSLACLMAFSYKKLLLN